MIVSYLTLRRWIGILAIAFPLLIILVDFAPMQTSISAYYWTHSGDIFVSILVMMGLFLLSYHGYDKRDDWITGIAGGAMIIVAFFPCEHGEHFISHPYIAWYLTIGVTKIFHYIFAVITFGLMGVMSMFQFTQTKSNMTTNKKKRNRVYRICGWVIFGALAAAAIVQIIPGLRKATDVVRLWYWLEALMIWAFGISWLVKGEALWAD